MIEKIKDSRHENRHPNESQNVLLHMVILNFWKVDFEGGGIFRGGGSVAKPPDIKA